MILRSALRIVAPHLSESFSFIDFGSTRAPGGTSNLVNLASAFTGASVANRVLVMLDNDTAGREAMQELATRRLGRNIRATLLPELRLAARYPILGPSGTVQMDVNGLAASIEIFCGRDVLQDEQGRLVPVQWTGYSQRMQAYQGELLNKKAIGDRIRVKLARGEANGPQSEDYSGLRLLVEMLKREDASFGRDQDLVAFGVPG